MQGRRVLGLGWKWGWLLGLGLLAGGLGSYLYARSLPPVYRAATTLLVTPAAGGGGASYSDLLGAERLARTYAQVLVSRPVLEAAGAAVGRGASAEQLGQAVSVELVRDTQLLRVTADDPDPAAAAALANGVAAAFIAQAERAQSGRLEQARAGLEAQLGQQAAALAGRRAAAEAARQEAATPEREARLAALGREVAELEQGYGGLLRAQDELRLEQARAADRVAVVEPAVAPVRPAWPNVAAYALVGAVLGLLGAAAGALGWEHLDDTLRTPERVGALLGLPVVGAVGRFRGGALAVVEGGGGGGEGGRGQAAEAYRALRVGLRVAGEGRPLGAVAVTSPAPGEGKTTTAANLACALAQGGQRVILVDADLRRPSLHRLFGLDNREGLTTLLLHEGGAEAALQPGGVEGLRVLTSGPLPPNPSELLGSARFGRALAALKGAADVVVLDAPPLLAVSDPVLVASAADGVLVVLDAGGTRAGAARRALEALGRAKAPVLGAVLNKARGRAGGYAEGYYYRYYRPDEPAPPPPAASPNGHAYPQPPVPASERPE